MTRRYRCVMTILRLGSAVFVDSRSDLTDLNFTVVIL